MANDDNNQIDKPADPDERIDLHTWPHTAVIEMNRTALEDFIAKLQTCLSVTAPPTGFLIEFKHVRGGVRLIIGTDDMPLAADGTQAPPS